MPDRLMSQALWQYLKAYDAPRICYDAAQDRNLCVELLNWSNPDPEALLGIGWELLTDTERALEQWWAQHPEERASRHHALADANALRAAWLSLWGV